MSRTSQSISLVVLVGACAIAPRSEWLPCTFVPIEDETRDTISHCARRIRDGTLEVQPAALDVLAARGVDPAPLVLDGTLHYLNSVGVVVPVLPFDNGPDYFIEGLARTVQGGKVGFIRDDLTLAIPPRWDFAFPFENGTAVVCNGCTFRPVGEAHLEVVGGRWGVIDREGLVVVPLVHSRDAVRALRGQ